MPKQPRLNPMEAQKAAVTFAQEYIKKYPLGLSGLTEDQFKTALDAIMQALVNAWGDGFYTGRAR